MGLKYIFVIILAILAVTSLGAFTRSTTVSAAPPSKPNPTPTSNYVGNDVSWPQCGVKLPTNHAFGIVGVNGGLASNENPCLSTQLAWANKALGTPNQPKIQVYVNTANPGEIIHEIKTWPRNNIDSKFNIAPNPFGECDGTNNEACSWQYGWNRAVEAVQDYFVPAARTVSIDPNPGAYKWWLDVETENTWQSTSSNALANNVATLEGMTDYYQSLGASVGLYSTSYQWGQIVGDKVSEGSVLSGLDSWLAGSRTLSSAQSKCTLPSLTVGGKVVLTQYVSKGLDYNYSCIK